MSGFERSLVERLTARLTEPRRLLQAVLGPRQVGKTTAVLQVQARLEAGGVPVLYASGDEPLLPGAAWVDQQWETARALAPASSSAVLVLDEVHRFPAGRSG